MSRPRSTNPRTAQVTAALTRLEVAKLDHLARREDVSRSAAIRKAVREYVARHLAGGENG